MRIPQRTTEYAAGLLFALGIVVLFEGADAERGRVEDLFFDLWSNGSFLGSAAVLAMGAVLLLSKRRRKLFLRGMLACFSAGATLFLVEVVGLIGWVDYERFFTSSEPALGSMPIPHVATKGVTYQDLAIAYGLPSEPVPFEFCTDRRGFRNDVDRADGEIYLLGDSLLVAGLLPFRQTVTALVENATGRSCVNLSLIAIGPQREVELLMQSQLALDGKILLHFIFEGNDLLDSRDWAERDRPKAHGAPLHRRLLSYRALMAVRRWTQGSPRPAQRAFGVWQNEKYYFKWLKNSFDGLHDEPRRILETLREVAERMERAGGRYAVVYVPAKIRVLGPVCEFPADFILRSYQEQLSPYREILRQQCKENGILFVDTTGAFEETVRSGVTPWFPLDTHPNAVGHEAMTRAIIASPVMRWITK